MYHPPNPTPKTKNPIIIGIAGDSGSGKTTYSDGIRRLIGSDIVDTIAMDGYHKVDLEGVWQVVQNNLPALIAEIEKVVPAEDEE